MKLLATFAALALGQELPTGPTQWNGVSESNTCGIHFSNDDSIVNKTCTITGSNIAYAFAGNGAVITGPNTFTGYDDVSTSLDMVVFFQQDCVDGQCNNATCWDVQYECLPNPGNEATPGVYFLESVNDHRQGPGASYNLQVYGAKRGDTLSIDLAGWAAQNISAAFGTVLATEDAWGNLNSANGAFSIQINDQPFGSLFQFSVTSAAGNNGPPDLWASSVSN